MRVSPKMSVVFMYLNTFNQNTNPKKSFKHFVIINADFRPKQLLSEKGKEINKNHTC